MCHSVCTNSTKRHCEPRCLRPEARVLKRGVVVTSYVPYCEIKCPKDQCETEGCPACEVVCRRPPPGYTIQTKPPLCSWSCDDIPLGVTCEDVPCSGEPSGDGSWQPAKLLMDNNSSNFFIIVVFMVFLFFVFLIKWNFSQTGLNDVKKLTKVNFSRKN
jgi:hypothetical protein